MDMMVDGAEFLAVLELEQEAANPHCSSFFAY